jgi:hypothetical protein
MRARLILKLMGIMVMLVLTIVAAKACSSSSPASPINPTNLARNGIAAVCAEQEAAAGAADPAGDGQTPGTAVSPANLSQLGATNPGGVQALEHALGGNLSCPTTTTVAGSGS